ncbi:MAG TPA: hypothetical protein ENJ16_03055 [Planctomycetaceae bacterium]|nr:hypothetical protein [Planctomycetaceae bacterium]
MNTISSVFLTLSLLLISTPLVAQGSATWDHQGPLPTGLDIRDVEVLSHDEAWIASEDGLLYHTLDSGITWSKLTLPVQFIPSMYDLFFLDSQRGWAIGNNTYRTTDGGQSWTLLSSSSLGTSYKTHFVTPQIGWISGFSQVCRTSDGGSTWTCATLPKSGACRGLFFVNAEIGYASNIFGDAFKTTNGGISWSQVLSGGGSNLNTIWFSDANNGFICASDRVQRTTNGGTTWQEIALPAASFMYAGVFLDAQQAWLVGSGGRVLSTTDGWNTATVQGLSAGPSLWGVSFTSTGFGLAVGNRGRILATGDGGATWSQRDSGGMDVHALDANDPAHAWAGLDQGDVAYTTNGGAQWLTVAVDGFSKFGTVTGVDFLDDNLTGWAAGEDDFFGGTVGVISKSTDGGRTWVQQYNQAIGNAMFEDIAALSATTAVAVGNQNFPLPGDLLRRTTDGGLTWDNVSPNLGAYSSVDFVDTQRGWAAGGQIIASTDGGLTWKKQYDPQYFVNDIDFSDAQNGWAVGEFGSAYRTTNGGITWIKKNVPGSVSQAMLTGVSAIDANVAWISTGTDQVLRTLDGGSTWSIENLPFNPGVPAYPRCAEFLDAEYGWIGGGPRVDNGGPWLRKGDVPGFSLLTSRFPRGGTATLNIKGAAPGEFVILIDSVNGIGAGPCFGNVCLGLLPKIFVLASGVADAAGAFEFSAPIPTTVPIVDLHAQAIRVTSLPSAPFEISNTITTAIEP